MIKFLKTQYKYKCNGYFKKKTKFTSPYYFSFFNPFKNEFKSFVCNTFTSDL